MRKETFIFDNVCGQVGSPHSWEAIDPVRASYTPDITPLKLAAHKNNYEILKILIDRGASVPQPHDIKCICDQCQAKLLRILWLWFPTIEK